MGCIEHIYSVSALIGGNACNGNCKFCAGKYLRPDAQEDNPIFWKNLESAIKLSARYGGWSLSLTSSGEPTIYPESVTKALEVYNKCANQGAYFPNVNLFTNGILLGNKDWCDYYLPIWKKLGLTNIAVSIHARDIYGQAEAYGLREYPSFSRIFDNIRSNGIGVRATLLLRRGGIDTPEEYKSSIESIVYYGCKNITSWSVANPDGTSSEFTPSWFNLMRIRWWLSRNAKLCHGHIWGGGVYDYNGVMVRLTDYVTKHNPNKDYVRQLVVFQDGTVAYSWIREGALCMK